MTRRIGPGRSERGRAPTKEDQIRRMNLDRCMMAVQLAGAKEGILNRVCLYVSRISGSYGKAELDCPADQAVSVETKERSCDWIE